jgi:primosomal protein N' (replication factor Y)
VFPPLPPAMARRAGFERGQVLVQSPRRAALQAFLPQWREALATTPSSARVRWAIDVDPASF